MFERTLHRRQVLAAGLLLLGLAATPTAFAPAALASGDPSSFVQDVSNKAITDLAVSAGASDKDRAVKLKPILEQYFDMPGIAKYMLGSYWRKATPDEQSAFTTALTDFLALSYGKRFASYTGHDMAIGRVRDEGDGLSTVFSVVKLASGEEARVDWVILSQASSFKISDVKVEGLSLADTHRQEFASVISNNGGSVAALIDVLKKKTGTN